MCGLYKISYIYVRRRALGMPQPGTPRHSTTHSYLGDASNRFRYSNLNVQLPYTKSERMRILRTPETLRIKGVAPVWFKF